MLLEEFPTPLTAVAAFLLRCRRIPSTPAVSCSPSSPSPSSPSSFWPFSSSTSAAPCSSAAGTPPPQAIDEDAPAAGLDPSLVASFPTFTYSWAKNLHAGKCGLECAVCLSELQDDDVLRLLAACSHVFNTDCIDAWLTSHTTCPYCRHQLNPSERKSPSSPPEVRIVVADGREVFEETRGGGGEEEEENERRGEEGRSGGDWKRMARSNSTGHSSFGREDRYTLRLPKDVKERIARERNWTGSCIDFRHLFGDHDDAREDDRQIGRSGLSEGASLRKM